MRFDISGNSDRMKQMNRSLVLHIIRERGPISKVEITKKAELTFPTISNIISELVSENVISENGYGTSSGGRKPVLYDFNTNHIFVIGVDLGVSNISVAAISLKGMIESKLTVYTDTAGGSKKVVDQIYGLIEKIIMRVERQGGKVASIGISSPGPVDSETGTVLSPPNLEGWDEVPLKKLIYQKFGICTLIEKDANAYALGEQWFAPTQSKKNVIFILVDQGIGGGIIIQNRIFKGSQNVAGEIGHGSIDVDGPRCNCGNYGCLEAMASGIAIVRRTKERIRRGEKTNLKQFYDKHDCLTLETIIEAGLEGDALAKSILDDTGRYLGIGVANLINFFNPDEMILGGEVINKYPLMIDMIEEIAKDRVFADRAKKVSLKRSHLKELAGVYGAASIAMQFLFDHPEKLLSGV